MIKKCAECGKPIKDGDKYFAPYGEDKEIYCSIRTCFARIDSRMRYQKVKQEKPNRYLRLLGNKRRTAREQRKRYLSKGNCLRCGGTNDNLEGGLKICTKCRGVMNH